MYTPHFFFQDRWNKQNKTKKKFLSLLSHKRTIYIYTQHTIDFFFCAWVCTVLACSLFFSHFDFSFFFIHLYTRLRRPLYLLPICLSLLLQILQNLRKSRTERTRRPGRLGSDPSGKPLTSSTNKNSLIVKVNQTKSPTMTPARGHIPTCFLLQPFFIMISVGLVLFFNY